LQHENLQQLTSKEALINKGTKANLIELEKSLDVKTQVVEKGTNTDPIDIITRKNANPTEVRISLDVKYKR